MNEHPTGPGPLLKTTPSDLRLDVGEMMCVGLHGAELTAPHRALLQEYGFGGVILFRRNVVSAAQVATLNRDLQGARVGEAPLLVSLDQEGGLVARMRGICTDFPAMEVLGRTGDVGLAHAFGACLGEELTALGFNLDYAPVVDVNSNPANPVIGSRSFGADPALVARMAAAQVHGMAAAGLLACAKHFPGHGDTVTDSHHELPVVHHDLPRMDAVELPPFARAIAAGVPAIMTAHVLFPVLDAALPATLSPVILQALLRERLGFKGVIVSDDLEMKAVAEAPGVVEAARLALDAGVDLLLVCHQEARQVAVWEALVRAGERSSAARERIRASAARVRHMKANLDVGAEIPPEEAEAHLRGPLALALADEITRRGAEAQRLAAAPSAVDPTEHTA